jgi:hypothetical protein
VTPADAREPVDGVRRDPVALPADRLDGDGIIAEPGDEGVMFDGRSSPTATNEAADDQDRSEARADGRPIGAHA